MKKFVLLVSCLFLFKSNAAKDEVIFAYPAESDKFNFLPQKFSLTADQLLSYRETPSAVPASDDIYTNLSSCDMLVLPINGSPGGTDTVSKSVLHETIEAARTLKRAAVEERPDFIFGVGRAGNFVIEALRYFYEQERGQPGISNPHVFSVAFSGSPDAVSPRDLRNPFDLSSDFKEIPFVNVMTNPRKNAFFSYLDSLGFDKASGKIWCVDILGSGAGLNSFLRLLRVYYIQKQKAFPDFRFWAMNLIETGRGALWSYNDELKTLTFDSDYRRWGMKPMTVSTHSLKMRHEGCVAIDSESVTRFYGSVPKFEAYQMKMLGKPGAVDPHQPGQYFDLFRNHLLIPGIKFVIENNLEIGFGKKARLDLLKILLRTVCEKNSRRVNQAIIDPCISMFMTSSIFSYTPQAPSL